MSQRLMRELLAAWCRGLPLDEARGLEVLLGYIALSKETAKSAPASLDRRALTLAIERLDEAEHWVLAAMREAVDRADARREDPP